MLRYIDSFDTATSTGILVSVPKWKGNRGSYIGRFNRGLSAFLYSEGINATFDLQSGWIIGGAFQFAPKVFFQDSVSDTQSFLTLYDQSGDVMWSVTAVVENGRGVGFKISNQAGFQEYDFEFPVATFFHMEFKVNDADGSVIRINDYAIDISSPVGLSDKANKIEIRGTGGLNTSGIILDDVYICDDQGDINNDFMGELGIAVFRPAMTGSSNEWVASVLPSSSTNKAVMVAETIHDYQNSATYNISDPVVGTADTYKLDLASFTATYRDVKAVNSAFVYRKNSVDPRTTRLFYRIDDVNYDKTTFNSCYTKYSYNGFLLELNPSTETDWGWDTIADMEFGIRINT